MLQVINKRLLLSLDIYSNCLRLFYLHLDEVKKSQRYSEPHDNGAPLGVWADVSITHPRP